MKNTNRHSEYDSSEQQDQVNINYFDKMRSIKTCKSVDTAKWTRCEKTPIDINEPQQQGEEHLKPKLSGLMSQKNQTNSNSNFSNNSNLINRRPLTAAYTFKLKTPQNRKKKNDPVSLFQQTSQVWRKDKFLTNRANNKEGRKLQLDKRNKQLSKF